MEEGEYHDVYKIVLIGDASVGKSNIINNYVKGINLLATKGPTVGLEYSTKTIGVNSSHTVKVQIWDTAGQQKFRSITTSHIKKALGAFVVFDITSRKSFQSVDYWLGQLKEKAVENVAVMLIGNKNDRAQYRDVSRQEAEEKARMVGIPYAETSAADAGSLEQIFMHLASMITSSKRSEENELHQSKSIPLMDKNRPINQELPQKGSRCC